MSQKRSRVKKHAQLRESMMEDVDAKIETKELSSFASKLHHIDENQFEDMNIASTPADHSPLHLRDSFFEQVEISNDFQQMDVDSDVIDTLIEDVSIDLIDDTDSFKSDYLKDFIEEAKQYNVEKGLRIDHDTRSNLLRELKAQKIYVEEDNLSKDELAFDDVIEEMEVLETLSNYDVIEDNSSLDLIEEESSESDPLEDSIMLRVAELSLEELVESDYDETPISTDLLEATTQLKVQLQEQDQVVKDMGSKLDKTSHAMNVLLSVLIFFLIVIVGVVGYVLLDLYGII